MSAGFVTVVVTKPVNMLAARRGEPVGPADGGHPARLHAVVRGALRGEEDGGSRGARDGRRARGRRRRARGRWRRRFAFGSPHGAGPRAGNVGGSRVRHEPSLYELRGVEERRRERAGRAPAAIFVERGSAAVARRRPDRAARGALRRRRRDEVAAGHRARADLPEHPSAPGRPTAGVGGGGGVAGSGAASTRAGLPRRVTGFAGRPRLRRSRGCV